MPLIEIRERPTLRRPLLLAGFGGWGDAGSGATSALSYLLGDGEGEPEPIAVLDPEACFDFTVQRPLTIRTPDGRWTLTYPSIKFFALDRPSSTRDLVVVTGPEPHLRWPTLTRAIADYAKALGVDMALTLGVFLGSVSHRSVSLVRRTLDPELDRALAALGAVDTGYQGPTGFITGLIHACTEAGIPAASIWAAAPIYLRAVNPAVAYTLLKAVEEIAHISLDLDLLRERSIAFVQEVDKMLLENPELTQQLSEMVDLGPPEPTPKAAQEELPPAQSLLEDLERFLKEKRTDSP
ncbi:MAG: PAC2 family protein [Dehalococcoidia bacterium]|nr:PAC2 family protein [Dehalococcoidia bacterium]